MVDIIQLPDANDKLQVLRQLDVTNRQVTSNPGDKLWGYYQTLLAQTTVNNNPGPQANYTFTAVPAGYIYEINAINVHMLTLGANPYIYAYVLYNATYYFFYGSQFNGVTCTASWVGNIRMSEGMQLYIFVNGVAALTRLIYCYVGVSMRVTV